MNTILPPPIISPDRLPFDHYIVAVRHPFADPETLRTEFSPSRGFVAKTFDGRPWDKHPRCRDVPEKNSGLIMRLVWFKTRMTTETVITRAGSLYRPATHVELLAFARTHPTFQQRFWIVALGSTMLHDSLPHAAVLEGDMFGRRILESYPIRTLWMPRRRFLFVYEGH